MASFQPAGLYILATVCIALIAPAVTRAQTAAYVPLKQLPELVDAQTLLQDLVDERAHSKINHFCILGKVFKNNEIADVFWKEENKVILWEPRRPGEMNRLIYSRRYLDLNHDVVNDPGTSTYLLQRSDVEREIAACAMIGDHFTVDKLQKPLNNG